MYKTDRQKGRQIRDEEVRCFRHLFLSIYRRVGVSSSLPSSFFLRYVRQQQRTKGGTRNGEKKRAKAIQIKLAPCSFFLPPRTCLQLPSSSCPCDTTSAFPPSPFSAASVGRTKKGSPFRSAVRFALSSCFRIVIKSKFIEAIDIGCLDATRRSTGIRKLCHINRYTLYSCPLIPSSEKRKY